MPKKLVIHAMFTYTDQNKQLARAYRGETINVTGKDLTRGEKFGAFGTAADLAPPVDEGVVDLTPDASTPLVPHVSQGVRIEAALRDRLGLEPGATESDVVEALDEALAKVKAAKEETPEPVPAPAQLTAPPAPVEPVIVNLPPTADDGDAGADQGNPDEGEVEHEGQAVVTEQTPTVEPPPQSAVKARWEAHAVLMGMTEGEAKAASKQDLITKYGS